MFYINKCLIFEIKHKFIKRLYGMYNFCVLYLKMFVINIEYLMCVNNNVFDTFQRSSKQMLQCDIHQS